MFLVIVAYEIISGAIEILFFDAFFESPSYLAAIMAIIGIIINLLMSQYIIHLGKKINSPALVADGHHQRVDIFSSVAVLTGVLVSKLGSWADPIIGLFIGIMILRTAYEIGVENINNIMGKVPSSEIADEIKEVAFSIDGVYEVNDIVINYIGPYATVSLNIELSPELTFMEAYDISNKVQNKIINNVSIIRKVAVHYSPLGLYDDNQE